MSAQSAQNISDVSPGEERTSVHWQRFSVPFAYPVVFTSSVFSPENTVFLEVLTSREAARPHRCLVFLDRGLAEARPTLVREVLEYFHGFGRHIALAGEPIVVPGGEAIKSGPQHVLAIAEAIGKHRLDRHSFVAIVGGGAVLDAVGLAASLVHRGLRQIRIPTTILAQNDAGVGVKNGINAFGAKNGMGTFAPPFAVVNDIELTRSLPPREMRSGVSEAVKVALIRDRVFFEWLEQNVDALAAFDEPAMRTMVQRCAELHMAHIVGGGDPFETGGSRPLDFGHWAAHKLEVLSEHALRHGEAVAIGIAIDASYSHLQGLLAKDSLTRIIALLQTLGFRLWHSAMNERDPRTGARSLLDGLEEFREHLGGRLTLTLLSGIGRARDVGQIDRVLMEAAIEMLPGKTARCS